MAVEFEKLVVLMEASVAKFDRDIQNIAKTVDTQMRLIETSTSRSTSTVEKNVETLASKLTGMRNLFTPLGAAAVAFGAIRFGENIVQNFDQITQAAREYGITVDQSLIQKMKDAEVASARAWTSIQVAAAPALASIATGLANIVSNIAGLPANIDQLTNSLRAAQAVAERSAGTGAGRAAAARVADLQAQIAAFSAPTNQAIANLNFAGTEEMRQKILKERKSDADEAAAYEQAQGKKALDEEKTATEQALRALDSTDEFFANEKTKRAHEAAQEQIKALEDVARANAKFEATVSRNHDKELNDRLDASMTEFREYQRIEEERARDAERINRQIADDIASFGDIMEQQGGKFGKAVEQMILDLAKLALRITATKALESALDDIGKASGGGFFGSIMNLIGLRAEGGPVSSGSPYIVGEQGPELFVPRVAGTIIPNTGTASASSGNMNLNVVVNGARGNSEIRDMVSAGVQQGIAVYDRQALPARVARLNADPRAR